MKIKVEIIERINGRNDIKRALLDEFGLSRGSVWRILKDNEENGPLTTYTALQIISKGLGISPEDALTDDIKQEVA